MNQQQIETYLLDTIDLMINERFKQLIKSNYYIEAKILSVNADITYNISYAENNYPNIKAREGLTLTVGDIVLVCVKNGNFSDKFIDLKRP